MYRNIFIFHDFFNTCTNIVHLVYVMHTVSIVLILYIAYCPKDITEFIGEGQREKARGTTRSPELQGSDRPMAYRSSKIRIRGRGRGTCRSPGLQGMGSHMRSPELRRRYPGRHSKWSWEQSCSRWHAEPSRGHLHCLRHTWSSVLLQVPCAGSPPAPF